MEGKTCIVYYHGNDWDGVPARQVYLMREMAEYLPVFYLDAGEDRKWRMTSFSPADGVTVVRGLIPMFDRFKRRGWNLPRHILGRRFAKRYLTGFERVIFWNAENWQRPYRFIPHDRLIFDCIDPPFTSQDADEYYRREHEVLGRADLVFATAQTLLDSCAEHNGRCFILNNACAPDEYSDDLLRDAERPGWWPQAGGPVAAYLGTLDWRVDFDALHAACVQNPGVRFVIAGQINPSYAGRVDELGRMPNVVCPGRITVEAGRYLMSRCSVGLIPFVPGEMNDAINPVKMYAYMLLGKPIVSTRINELVMRQEQDWVFCSDDESGFASAIGRAIALSPDTGGGERLQQYALANTWGRRAEAAWGHIESELNGAT